MIMMKVRPGDEVTLTDKKGNEVASMIVDRCGEHVLRLGLKADPDIRFKHTKPKPNEQG